MRILVSAGERLLSGTLTRWGYEVVVASDGAEALRCLQEEDPPKLAILNWEMEALGGPDVCKSLRKGMTLELFFDVFNVYNRQGTAAVDETYAPPVRLAGLGTSGNAGAPQNANPVSGGTYSDLIWVKTIDVNGNELNQPIGRNPDFLNTVARYAPTYARIGARLTF